MDKQDEFKRKNNLNPFIDGMEVKEVYKRRAYCPMCESEIKIKQPICDACGTKLNWEG